MRMPSKQIGWGTEEKLLWQIGNQLEYLTKVTNKALSDILPLTYRAMLVQTGNTPPTATELVTSLNMTVEYTYNSPGSYLATFSDSIGNSPNIPVSITNNSFVIDGDVYTIQCTPVFFNTVLIESFKNGNYSDDVIGSFSSHNPYGPPTIFEVQKYPDYNG